MPCSQAVYLSIFSLITLLLIYGNIHQPMQRTLLSNKIFAYVVLSSMLIVFFDIISVLANGQQGQVFYFFNKYANLLLLMIDVIPSMLWFCYVHLYLNQDTTRCHILKNFMLALFITNAAICVASLHTGWVFSIDEYNLFHRGHFYWINVFDSFFFLIWATLNIIIKRKTLEKKIFRALLIFILPVSIGGLLQTVYQGGALTWGGLTISLLIVCFNIQNKNLTTDYLTGIYNRRQLDHYIMQKIQNSTTDKSFAAILIDLDNFKFINDNFGHSTGDQVLQTAVKLIRESLRKEDFIARYGGDEFCVVLDIDKNQLLEDVIKRIKNSIVKFNNKNPQPYQIGLSMGYAIYKPSLGKSYNEFLSYIDNLMYKDKKNAG